MVCVGDINHIHLQFFPEKGISEETENNLYFQIADFIYFIKYLEKIGFIAIQHTTSNTKEKDYVILYDNKKYKYDDDIESDFPFLKLGYDKFFAELEDGPVYKVADINYRKINLDFVNDLQNYATGIIYPLPLAEDYVDNDLCTLEQSQFDKQMRTALKSAKYGRWAAYLGVASALVAIVTLGYTLVTNNKPISINRLDLERIETAIKANHVSEPFEVTTNDTLVVKTEQPIQNKN